MLKHRVFLYAVKEKHTLISVEKMFREKSFPVYYFQKNFQQKINTLFHIKLTAMCC